MYNVEIHTAGRSELVWLNGDLSRAYDLTSGILGVGSEVAPRADKLIAASLNTEPDTFVERYLSMIDGLAGICAEATGGTFDTVLYPLSGTDLLTAARY